MYCHNCGAKIEDGAKFCTGCGQQVIANVSNRSTQIPLGGILVVTRSSCPWNSSIPVEIWINGIRKQVIRDGETLTIRLSSGNHTVTLRQQGRDIITRIVSISDGGKETIFFEALQTQRETENRNVPAPVGNYNLPISGNPNTGMRICPRCGGTMTTHIVTESRNAGCGTILLYILLAMTVLGLLIVIPLVLRKDTETVTYVVCQRCGYQRVINRR